MIFNKDQRLKHLGFDDTKILILGVPIVSIFVPIAFFDVDYDNISGGEVLMLWVQSLTHCIVYWVGIRSFMIFIRKRYPGFEKTRFRIIISILFIIIYGGIAGGLISLLYEEGFACVDQSTPLEGFIATYFTSFFVVAIYEGVFLYHQNEINILQSEKLKQDTIRSELQGLRSQVNPHFLFNSMNTLMNIIYEDRDLAISFLKKLSNVYRYVLDKDDDHLIPLSEELKFIESYIFLQKERFRHNLNVALDINDVFLDRLLVPLSLQLLFENAIKHNIISSKKPLSIDVFIDQNQKLVVKNNLQPKNQALPSTGIGLKNIQSRYQYFTDQEVEIIKTEKEFMVKIPLLNHNKVNAE